VIFDIAVLYVIFSGIILAVLSLIFGISLVGLMGI